MLTKIMRGKIFSLLNTRALWPYDIPIGIAVFALLWMYSPAWLTVTVVIVGCVILATRIIVVLAAQASDRRLAKRHATSEPVTK